VTTCECASRGREIPRPCPCRTALARPQSPRRESLTPHSHPCTTYAHACTHAHICAYTNSHMAVHEHGFDRTWREWRPGTYSTHTPSDHFTHTGVVVAVACRGDGHSAATAAATPGVASAVDGRMPCVTCGRKFAAVRLASRTVCLSVSRVLPWLSFFSGSSCLPIHRERRIASASTRASVAT
jgi:hypothetical protein